MNPSNPNERLIRRREVENLTGLKRSILYAMARDGRFPAPLKLSRRCSAWQESKVRDWIAARIAQAGRA